MSDCQIRFGPASSTRPHSFFLRARRRRERTSNPRSRITRNTRLRFTDSPFFRRNHHALADSRTPASLRRPSRSAHRGFGRSTASRLLPVVQTRPADGQGRRHQRGRVALSHHLSRLGVNLTAAHSPTTFFRISISNDFRPSVRSNCRMRWSFSVSAAAALLPPSAAFAPCSASSFQR